MKPCAGECIPPRTVSLAAATFRLLVTIANLDLAVFQVIIRVELCLLACWRKCVWTQCKWLSFWQPEVQLKPNSARGVCVCVCVLKYSPQINPGPATQRRPNCGRYN